MGFGERLREERLRLALSQPDMAEKCGVSRNSQINYEAEKNSPSVEYFRRAAVAGADVAYIITGARSAQVAVSEVAEDADVLVLSAREKAVIKEFSTLDEAAKRAVEHMVGALTAAR